MSEDKDKKKGRKIKIVEPEEWNAVITTLTFLHAEYEKTKIIIQDIYNKIKEIKNEK